MSRDIIKKDPVFQEKIWNIMIAFGGAIKADSSSWNHSPIDYYGGTIDADKELTERAYQSLFSSGCNYYVCSEIEDDSGSYFRGTFVDSGRKFFLRGTLVTGEGRSFYWASLFDEMALSSVMKLLSHTVTFEDALESLLERLTRDRCDFGTTCEIPL